MYTVRAHNLSQHAKQTNIIERTLTKTAAAIYDQFKVSDGLYEDNIMRASCDSFTGAVNSARKTQITGAHERECNRARQIRRLGTRHQKFKIYTPK